MPAVRNVLLSEGYRFKMRPGGSDPTIFSDLRLRGRRTYIHGTDIFSSILAFLKSRYGEIASLDVSFRRLSRRSLQIYISDQVPGDACVRFTFRYGSSSATGYLLEVGAVIDAMERCLEPDILDRATINCELRSATIDNTREFPNINCCVAMGKALILSTVDMPNVWLGRAHLHGPVLMEGSGLLAVRVEERSKLPIMRTDVWFNGLEAGRIHSVLNPGS